MNSLKILLGTVFGAGTLPKAPGTWGSIASLPLIYLAFWMSPQFGVIILCLTAILLSLWTSDAAVEKYGDDPAQFVMDETAGQSLVFISTTFLYSVGPDLILLLTGFILFRFFDIYKPLGIDKLQEIDGKVGILADDLLAGFYSLIVIEILTRWIYPGIF